MARPTMGLALRTSSAPNLLAMRKSSATPDVPMNSTVPISTMTERASLPKTASTRGPNVLNTPNVVLATHRDQEGPVVRARRREIVAGGRFSSANAAPG